MTELVTIEQLDPMGLDLRPPARYVEEATELLNAGLKIKLTVEGEKRHPHIGESIFIDNKVDEQTSTFLLRAKVPNPAGTILPGEYIKATMEIGQYVDAIVVPEQAVLEGQEGTRVFVVNDSNQVDVAKVKGLDSYRGLRVLEAGLEAGRRVIVEGVQLVRQGQKVELVSEKLEKFMAPDAPPPRGDPRFSSPLYRGPASGASTQKDSGAKAPAGKTGPEASKPEEIRPRTPEVGTKPQAPAQSPAGDQPR
jgi:membrane fusion protein (multidrug efflux system)